MQPSSSELALVPYAKVNGEWMLPDVFILEVAHRCKVEKTFETVFYDGTIKTELDFLEAMQRPANVPVFVFKGTEPVGFGWLNGISGSFAFAHFCMMRGAWGLDTQAIGRLMLDYWMSFSQPSGAPLLHLIIGVIPDSNVKAISFVQKIGFVKLGEIPQLLGNVYEGTLHAASVLYYSRVNNGRR